MKSIARAILVVGWLGSATAEEMAGVKTFDPKFSVAVLLGLCVCFLVSLI